MNTYLKCLSLLVILTLGITFTFAKTPTETRTGTLTGKVYDAALDQPLPYVNVLLLNEDRKTLMGTITENVTLMRKIVEVVCSNSSRKK